MLDQIAKWDEELFLWLNGFHVDFLDPVMLFLTKTYPWIPMYAFLLFLVFKTYGKASWWVVLAIGLTILLADQTASGLMKPFFARLRPCHEPMLEGMMYNYGGCWGRFGFVSSHASNSFAVATLMTLTLGQQYPKIKWLFLWAGIFTYTRIYLGVHYPGDVVVGALVGVLSAMVAFYLFRWLYSLVAKKQAA
jgi:undecaprenyl-diphosphatase